MSQQLGTDDVPHNMIEKKIPSALPLYFAAGAFVAGALVLPVYSLWALLVCSGLAAIVYGVAQKKIPARTVLVEAPDPVFATGEQDLDAMLTKAGLHLKSLATLNDRIPDAKLSQNISRMEKAGRAILAQVEKQPAKARAIRKFVTYYLPTSVKLLTTYAELSASGAQGKQAQSLMCDIQNNAATIAAAFEAQLDSLFADKALDVSADIAVLDSMMKGDGFMGTDAVQQAASPNLHL